LYTEWQYIKKQFFLYSILTNVTVELRIEADLPLVAIDAPSVFDELQLAHGSGGAVAVNLEQLHRAHNLIDSQVRAVMFHDGLEASWIGVQRRRGLGRLYAV
jgi:hypothetical protein